VNGDVVVAGDLTAENLIVGSTNVITELTSLDTLTAGHTEDLATNTAAILTKQDLIQDDYLTISKTLNLQSSLDTLQTNIDLKQDTISNFEIDGSVNLDTTGISFDTLVIRRVNGITGYSDNIIHLTEIHIWVDDKNMLFESSSSLTSSIVSWSDKEVDIGYQTDSPPSNLYDNIRSLSPNISDVLSPVGSPSDVAIIIKNIPLTKINNIQAIQIFNSTHINYGNRAIGLTVELYNSKNDPNLNTILAYSSEFIDNWAVYRIDFPSIDTYSLVFTGSLIVPNTGLYVNLVYLEDATINLFPFNILGNVDVVGDLTAENLIVGSTNVITELNTKQDIITDGSLTIARTDGLQSLLDSTAKLATANTFTANQSITGDVDVVGDLTASSAIVNGVNINTSLTDILSRLTALENA